MILLRYLKWDSLAGATHVCFASVSTNLGKKQIDTEGGVLVSETVLNLVNLNFKHN